jgi:hypothetical protein
MSLRRKWKICWTGSGLFQEQIYKIYEGLQPASAVVSGIKEVTFSISGANDFPLGGLLYASSSETNFPCISMYKEESDHSR